MVQLGKDLKAATCNSAGLVLARATRGCAELNGCERESRFKRSGNLASGVEDRSSSGT